MFLTFSGAFAIAVSLVIALRPSDGPRPRVNFVGFDGPGVLALFILYVAASAYWGQAFAMSVLAALALHEMGHVLANHSLGRGGTRVRLLPKLSGHSVEERPFHHEGDAFFVALMGAGFSLAPMVLSMALGLGLSPHIPEVGQFLLILGATIGLFNFVALLPFPRLDGGLCAEMAARNFWPALAPGMSAFMVSALVAAGVRTGAISLFLLAGLGLFGLIRRPATHLVPMGPNTALIALAAYSFTLAAHFMAANTLIGPVF